MKQNTITNQVIKQGSSTKLNSDQNNCTVLALAATVGISYDEAYKIAEDVWSRKRKKGVRTKTLETYLDAHANKVETKKVYHVKRDNKDVVCKMNLSTFTKEYPQGNYYVLVSGHALAINDGKILDHGKFIDKTKRLVKHAWKIK
jgi:hypothetical protein